MEKSIEVTDSVVEEEEQKQEEDKKISAAILQRMNELENEQNFGLPSGEPILEEDEQMMRPGLRVELLDNDLPSPIIAMDRGNLL